MGNCERTGNAPSFRGVDAGAQTSRTKMATRVMAFNNRQLELRGE